MSSLHFPKRMTVGAYIITFWVAMIMPLVAGFCSIAFPTWSEFWEKVVLCFILAGVIWTILASVFKWFIPPKGRIIPITIGFNFTGIFSSVFLWRITGETLWMGILLTVIYIACIVTGYKYRKTILQEGLAPKTQWGKRVAVLGGISPVGFAFFGGVLGSNAGGAFVASIVMVTSNFLCLYFTANIYRAENPDWEPK